MLASIGSGVPPKNINENHDRVDFKFTAELITPIDKVFEVFNSFGGSIDHILRKSPLDGGLFREKILIKARDYFVSKFMY